MKARRGRRINRDAIKFEDKYIVSLLRCALLIKAENAPYSKIRNSRVCVISAKKYELDKSKNNGLAIFLCKQYPEKLLVKAECVCRFSPIWPTVADST